MAEAPARSQSAPPGTRPRAGRRLALLLAILALGACSAEPPPADNSPARRLQLADGWRIRAAAEVTAGGETVSSAGFDDAGWHAARVPSTVLGALVDGGLYGDPYFGDNLERIPKEQFAGAWWYRREIEIAPPAPGTRHRLELDGVNQRANVWLNGELVAGAGEVVGAFRRFRFDVTGRLTAGVNALAIEVLPPRPGDFTIGFVDWNPVPPDRNMGLWRGVALAATGAVEIDDVFVRTDLDLGGAGGGAREGRVTVSALLANGSPEPVAGELRGEIEGRRFRLPYVLAAGEEQRVELSPERLPELTFERPRLWWPHDLGEPALYELRLEAAVGDGGGEVSDAERVTFGMREVSDYRNAEGHRGYRINGREVLIRGGGWVDELLLREDPRKVEDQVLLAKHANLNALRLEGFWGSSETIYELADRHGLLVLVGWSCQWEWEEYLGGPVDEFGGIDTEEEIELVAASWADQVAWLRNHPSVLVWVLASDMLPRPALERRYRDELAALDPSRPALAACSVRTSEVSGPTGVKMNGPYDWVPPVYWYLDRERGGAYGFNTETGPGPQPPPLESVRRMIPPEHLWPIDEMWDYHCGRHEFNTLDRYNLALDRRYGPSDGVEEYLVKAQAASYEAVRAMFEAFAVNRPSTTGVVQWMLNSAWPEMYWQLYDYYLMPNGAFYGTRMAGQPLSLVYDYGDGTVRAVNATLEPAAGLEATVRVLGLDSRVIHEETVAVDVPPGRAAAVAEIAAPPGEPVWFLDLRLRRPGGAEAGRNFYWLSAKPDVLDWEASTWFYTPAREFADFTALDRLPPARLAASVTVEEAGDDGERLLRARLRNEGDSLAFFVELRAVDAATGATLLPVRWDDNYVSLLPGEERELTARFRAGDGPAGGGVRLDWSGWNVAPGSAAP